MDKKPWLALLTASYLFHLALGCSESNPQAGDGANGGDNSGSGGKSTSGGSTSSGGGNAGTGGGGSGGLGGEGNSGPIEAVDNTICPPEDLIGRVTLRDGYVNLELYDRPDPYLGPPELSTDTCVFHRFNPELCGSCAPSEVCGFAEECVPTRRTIKDAELLIRSDGEEERFETDPVLGGISKPYSATAPMEGHSFELTWDGRTVVAQGLRDITDPISDVSLETEGSRDGPTPGALTLTWTGQASGLVWTHTRINHHAGGPTFLECNAPANAELHEATADMVNPLSVHTGLEFQGVEHVHAAAAKLNDGCIEFRVGVHLPAP